VERDCRARGLNTEDAMCRSRWRKQIGMIDDHDECSGPVGECFFWYRLTRVVPDKFHRAVKRLCVCVCDFKDGLRQWFIKYSYGLCS